MSLPVACFFDLNQECENIAGLLHEGRQPEPLAVSLAFLGWPAQSSIRRAELRLL